MRGPAPLSKPCEWGQGPDCLRQIVLEPPLTLARWRRRRFCSHKCHAAARLAAGWQPGRTLTPEVRKRGQRAGGLATARQRQQLAMIEAAERLEVEIPIEIRRKLTDAEENTIKILIIRGQRLAYARGRNTRNRHAARESVRGE